MRENQATRGKTEKEQRRKIESMRKKGLKWQ